jgi:hypothetical protein
MGHGMIAGHGLFLGAAALGGALTLITESLSLGHRLTPGWLAVSWGLAGGIGLWAFRGRRLDSAPPARMMPMPRVALGTIGTILAVTGAIALLAPPNNWDSMTYHMPRVAHWSQAGSVAHYPTHILRQLWLGPGAEFVIAHLYVLTGGDRLANLVQWLAFAACIVGSAIVAGELGGGPRSRAVAAVACATLPMAIAQASSTQNDLVASFWMLSLGYWVLRFRVAPGVGTATLVGISAGLGGLTKLPVWFLAVPWLLAFVVIVRPLGRRSAMCCIMAAGLSAAILNFGHVSRTVPLVGRDGPSPPPGVQAGQIRLPPVWTMYINTTVDPRALVSNVLRNATLHAVTPYRRLNARLQDTIVGAHRAMGFDSSDGRTTFGPMFHVGRFRLHEDFVGNPLHLLAGLVAGAIAWRRREAFASSVRLWVWMSAASAIAFCAAVKWQPWNSRLHLPLFVLAAPLIGVALEGRRRLTLVCATAFCLLALPSLAMMWPRPLIWPDSVLTMPRTAQRFRNHPQLQPVYEAAVDVLSDMRCKHVGLVLGGDDWEYPFWPLLRARLGPDLRVEHVLVQNASGWLAALVPGAPCALIVTGHGLDRTIAWQGRTFVERWGWTPVRVYGAEP